MKQALKLSVIIFCVFLSGIASSQTTLLNPTGDGGFETGASFALNNWTVVNDGTNTWQVGTAATQYAGSRGAYVSNNGGTTWAYTNSNSETSHFYKNITVPAGESKITLTFYWKGNGESGYDRLLVYTAPTSVTPTAGTPASTSTTLTGATLAYTQSSYAQASYTMATVTLPASLAGTTFRLIFTWQNDNLLGTSPGIAVDNISVVSEVPPPPPSNDECAGATAITVNDCSFTSCNNTGATASSGIPAPGCAGTVFIDTWYKVTVPAGVTQLLFETQGDYLADLGMALYSGTCGALTLVECDDDDGASWMPSINRSGLTSGATYYIRVWSWGGTDFGTFGIRVIQPGNLTSINLNGNMGTVSACCVKLYDNAGPSTDYGNNQNSTITFQAGAGQRVQVDLWALSTELDYDTLFFYDGNSTSSTLIHSFTGNYNSATLVTELDYELIFTSSGQYLTVKFKSDNTGKESGFAANITCVATPAAPGLCNGNNPAGNTCSAPTQICDVDGYCGNTSNYFTPDLPGNMAEFSSVFGGSIENNSWISFTAMATSASLQFDVSNCQYNSGIQMGIYSGTNCNNFSLLTDIAMTSGSAPLGEGSYVITANGLTIGNTYYIMVDGYAGDICDYTITVLSGIMNGSITDTGNGNVCYGATGVTYTMNAAATSFTWSVPAGATITSGQGTSQITVNWGTASSGNVTCTANAGACAGASSTLAVTVTVPATASISYTGTPFCKSSTSQTVTLTGTGTYTGGTFTSSPAGLSINSSSGTINPSSSTAGTYTITYTIPAAGSCGPVTTTTSITVRPALTANTTPSNVNCYGDATGGVTLNTGGGTPGYTYNWSNSTTNQNLSNIAAGTYTVTVTDANSCTVTSTATVTQPSAALSTTISGTDVSCNGSATGVVNTNPSGGTSPYTYTWDDPSFQTTQNATGLYQGTYSVTITDSKGCTTTASQLINEPAAIIITPTINNATCGNSDGSASISVNGGTAPYSYSWSSGETTNSISNKTAGTYTVTVTDNNSCTNTASVVIDDSGAPTASINSQTNVLCNGNNTGEATISITGGTTPYTILWSSGGNGLTESNLSAGTYTVTITDATSCVANVNITITQPNALNVSVTSQTNVNCFGENNGSAIISVSGGTGAGTYSYAWTSGISTTNTASSLTAGIYTVTVTDANNCTKTKDVTITEPTLLTSSISAQTNILCFNVQTGEATISVSGGSSPYTYAWSSGGTGLTESNLAAGTYSFTATDSHNCVTTNAVTITEPQELISSISSNTNLTCNNSGDGSITASVTGGTSPYTYLWSSGGTALTESNLSAGSHTITVTDANSCTSTSSIVLTEPTVLNSIISSSNNVSCNGLSDGSATVLASDGTSPYTYVWSNGGTSVTESNLIAGVYVVTVIDNNGCEDVSSVTISEPLLLTATAIVTDSITCYGLSDGTVSVSFSGGTSPYIFNWSNGGSSDIETGVNAGGYDITVTDNNGCTATSSVVVTEPADLIALAVGSDVLCNSGNDGSIDLTITGGSVPYLISWSNNATTEDISGLAAGTYDVTVTDFNGCIANASGLISEPTVLVLTPSSTPSSCGNTDATATVTPSGGSSPYTYLWSNSMTTQTIVSLSAGSYHVTVTDNNGCKDSLTISISDMGAPVAVASVLSNVSCNGYTDGSANVNVTSGNSPFTYLWSDASSQTSQTASGLSAGTYNVTVFDTNNCKTIESVTITQPAILSLSTTKTDVKCNSGNDGAINLTVGGGTTPYSYLWDDALNSTNEDLSNLSIGIYTVTVTDANLCTSNISTTITEPSIINASIIVTNVSCNGGATGEVNLTVSGGITPYTFKWDDQGNSTIEDLVGLTIGTYSVTVTDANSCTAMASASITEPNVLVANISGSDIICYGGSNGSADLTVTGGTTPYTYSWSNSATSEDISNLSFGDYTVVVVDNNSCSATATITINQPTELTISFSNIIDAICTGNGGAVTADITGGVSPYTYSWDLNAGSQTSQTATSLSAGTYQLTVTDNNSCTANSSVTINSLAGGTAIITSSTNNNCYGDKFGSATASMTVGTSPYTYLWSNSVSTATANSLTAGVYTVTITDSNGCVSSTSVTISEPSQILLTTTQTPTNCYGGSGGTATVSVSGGTAPFTYLWNDSNNQTTITATDLNATGYTVTVTDSHGCTSSANITVLSPEMMTVVASQSNVKCKGFNNGAITLTVNGGTTPYTYNWSNGSNSVTVINLATGVYSVTVTDNNGCTVNKEVTITEPASDLQFNVTTVEADCYNGNNGEATVNVVSGTSPYTYIWSNNQTSQTATGLIANNYYTVTVTDVNTCSSVGIVNIGSPSQIERVDSLTTINNTSCMGSLDGSIFIKYTGGTSPYTYNWSNGKTDDKIYDLSTGTYFITITDFHNCELVDTFEVGTNPVNCLDIPTAFTPNGDSYNDTWEIKYLYLYPNASIKVFNRWGQLVYECKDGCKPWDGTHNGKPLAFGPFTYIIDLNDGTDPINGVVTLIK